MKPHHSTLERQNTIENLKGRLLITPLTVPFQLPRFMVTSDAMLHRGPDRSSTVAVCFQPGVARALRTSCARSSLIRSSIGLLSSLRTSSLLLALLLSDPSRQIPLLISYPNSPCLGHSPLCMAPTMLCGFYTYLH